MNGQCVGIDVGTRNLSVTVVENGKFVYCALVNLKKGKPIKDEVERLVEFLNQRFGRFWIVGIENQIRGVMKRAEILLMEAFKNYAKHVLIIRPQAVKTYFNYSGLKSYADRKRVGVDKFMRLCKETGQYDSVFRTIVKGTKKTDDLADSSLIAYYVYTESEMLLKKKAKKKKPVNLAEWARKQVFFSVSDMPAASKKRKLGETYH
jgi:hypothetical protein